MPRALQDGTVVPGAVPSSDLLLSSPRERNRAPLRSVFLPGVCMSCTVPLGGWRQTVDGVGVSAPCCVGGPVGNPPQGSAISAQGSSELAPLYMRLTVPKGW